ncbi:RimK family alpha-L-glutamate ligase [Candidatus Woesearchaeota archaeon]|jgi:ribosomal protein S6--L-glutamate ligase|nr:RimK family alpha-L-glutamate ligase [Candidatus Woesearchaeota archaeon]MBT5342499.1 RimK family alpha-L-glutamate ligase [Candidatus Woesearchaeota archaeon]
MKGAIISLGSKSSQMVADAMKRYFKTVDMIQLKEIEVSMGKDGGILYQGNPLKDYDCIYVKGSFRYANLLASIANLLEGKVPYMPIAGSAFTIVHNKLLTHLALQQHNIPMPKTYVSSTVEAAKELLDKVNYPIVMKFPEGTQGKGVMFADSKSSAASLLDALVALNQPFIIQEYIETGGTDVRALVVGGKVVAAMKRKAQKEDKRSNIHAGGTGESVELTRELINIALDTAKALKVDVCGVDILESPLGPLVIEANISPGLQGLSKAVSVDVPNEIARHFFLETEAVVKKNKHHEEKKALAEMKLEDINGSASQEVITNLQFRGDRILLPEIVTKLCKFDDRKEYVLKIKKGKLELEEFKI